MKPDRGFPPAEYHERLKRAQALMAKAELSALLLTTEPEVRYFSGFLTRFWESPTRPWYMIVPASGAPIAVIPSIGAVLMGETWINDIRTWTAPNLSDDGVSLLIDVLAEVTPTRGRIGIPSGHETHVRMPLADLERLRIGLGDRQIAGDGDIMRSLRMVKSSLEVAKIRAACQIAGRAFDRVPEIAREGASLAEVFRNFQILCLSEGADWVPYLAGGAGQNGYGDVISPAAPAALKRGDILMLDTGLVWDGYFCDFDRNFAIGEPNEKAKAGYRKLIDATTAGLEIAKPGATAAQVFHDMDKIVTSRKASSDAGRLGHGLGMQLTEWPSLIAQDHTVLQVGMVLTLEPGIEIEPGQYLVHEENILITANGAEMLSPAAALEIPML
ncbi:MAG: Xaa-Pro aminopeptidase [Paracoccaceae bacterium]|jgi:Xaa-Pro aminopeptidase